MTQKYLRTDGILQGKYKKGDSYIWKSIIRAAEHVGTGFKPQLGDDSSSLWYVNWLGTGRLCDRLPFVNIADTRVRVADLWQEGQWNLNVLYTVLPPEIIAEIMCIQIPPNRNHSDALRWIHSPNGYYTPSTAYHSLTAPVMGDFGIWRKIWKTRVPEKIRFFLWLVAHGALPSNVKRFKAHLAVSAACSRCDSDQEDLDHIFRGCPDSRRLWSHFQAVLPPLAIHMDFDNWLGTIFAHRNSTLGFAVLWWAWRWRNHSIFETQNLPLNQVLRCVLRDEALWRETMNKPLRLPEDGGNTLQNLPPFSVYVAVDGSWNPQVGRMGCAAVFRDSHGKWMSASSLSYDNGSSFLSELKVVELGLQHALEQGHNTVDCKSDCLQVVQALQAGGDTSSFWDREEIRQVRGLLLQFQSFRLCHVDRNKNNTADKLAREACSLGSPLQVGTRPPSFVYASLYLDAVS